MKLAGRLPYMGESAQYVIFSWLVRGPGAGEIDYFIVVLSRIMGSAVQKVSIYISMGKVYCGLEYGQLA